VAKGKYRDGRRNNRPPVEHRFKPGQSGNKKGRPANKGLPSVTELITRLLREKHPIVVRGRQKMVRLEEMIFMRIFERAYKGDLKAIMLTLDLIENSHIAEMKRSRKAVSSHYPSTKDITNMSLEELEKEYRRLVNPDRDSENDDDPWLK
jgi:hypothetical protein